MVEEPELFKNALLYCYEDNTYGMKALYDTYKYYLEEQKEDQSIIIGTFKNIGGIHNIPEVIVQKRSVEKYENLILSEKKEVAV